MHVGRRIFVDDTGSYLGFTRTYARSPRGERAYGAAPRNTGVNHTVITAMSAEGMLPRPIVEGGVTARTFEMRVAHCLGRRLRAGMWSRRTICGRTTARWFGS